MAEEPGKLQSVDSQRVKTAGFQIFEEFKEVGSRRRQNGVGRESGELLFNEYRISVWDDETVLVMGGGGYTTVNVLNATELYN